MTTYLLYSQLKRLHFLILLIRLYIYQTEASSVGILITFVASVINLIYSKQLILQYIV